MAEELENKPVENNAQAQEFTQEDITQNKAMAIFAYIGPMVFIPMFAAKQSKFAHFHAVQGFTLFIFEAAVYTLSYIFFFIPYMWWLGFITNLVIIPLVVFSILGIVSAAKGEARVLPIVGGIKIIK